MNTQQHKAGSGDLRWFKSSYSGSDGGDCVEVAARPHTVHVRDSKSPHGPLLAVPTSQWARFVTYAAGRTTH
ncbi:DUF397 domain-containing protein [Streptomyces marispadix]|uniref:DUF397 domain-containing protein n=1 Tax=Streptomyces marispadix TaxID=2922868 RepID=A0ABS9T4X3_9ACTN|nr:DUF397 domain-containing protein [Streptomyces marispadix]MCH6163556.1 DUF397 domain-containing protein [Streptomyces marispadix]